MRRVKSAAGWGRNLIEKNIGSPPIWEKPGKRVCTSAARNRGKGKSIEEEAAFQSFAFPSLPSFLPSFWLSVQRIALIPATRILRKARPVRALIESAEINFSCRGRRKVGQHGEKARASGPERANCYQDEYRPLNFNTPSNARLHNFHVYVQYIHGGVYTGCLDSNFDTFTLATIFFN